MPELPTPTQVFEIRSDIDSHLSPKLTIDEYMNQALAQVKRDVEDKKGIMWHQVYDADNSQYFDNSDGTARNDDRLKHAIALLTIAYVFRDHSINRGDDGKWWGLYEAYRGDYDNLVDTMVLDIDHDESGTVDESEEKTEMQVFLNR